jgi:phospholipase/carboxylesterase
MSMGGPLDTGAIHLSRAALQEFLSDCLQRYPIDPKKLALLGFSQGGVMAYSLVMADPTGFAAIAALSTWLPTDLVSEPSAPDGLQSLPTLVQHGTEDSLIEVSRARDSVERLRQLRVPLTYREYPMGHEITPRSLADLSTWLAEKVLSPVILTG